jgi:hypothetical protein
MLTRDRRFVREGKIYMKHITSFLQISIVWPSNQTFFGNRDTDTVRTNNKASSAAPRYVDDIILPIRREATTDRRRFPTSYMYSCETEFKKKKSESNMFMSVTAIDVNSCKKTINEDGFRLHDELQHCLTEYAVDVIVRESSLGERGVFLVVHLPRALTNMLSCALRKRATIFDRVPFSIVTRQILEYCTVN